MATYHQLTLFNLEPYSSKNKIFDNSKTHQIEEQSKEIEFDQLELNLFPKPPLQFSIENLKRVA